MKTINLEAEQAQNLKGLKGGTKWLVGHHMGWCAHAYIYFVATPAIACLTFRAAMDFCHELKVGFRYIHQRIRRTSLLVSQAQTLHRAQEHVRMMEAVAARARLKANEAHATYKSMQATL